MSKRAVTIATWTLWAPLMLSLPAKAMRSGPPSQLRVVLETIYPVEKAGCGWYPIDYPQSWAVYTRGWGCRYVYSPYYYDPYLYGPYNRVYYPPVLYRRGPYWPQRLWYSWY